MKEKLPERKCQYCNSGYLSSFSYQKYCSPKCARDAQPFYQSRQQLKKRCVFCGNEYLTFRKAQKYCSSECQTKVNRIRLASSRKRSATEFPHLKMRFQVFARDKFRCQYCGRGIGDGVKLEVDHIIPKSKNGQNGLDNYTTACSDCNEGKKDILLQP